MFSTFHHYNYFRFSNQAVITEHFTSRPICLKNNLNDNNILFHPQLVTPKFPVVVKIGHAHSGLGKVGAICCVVVLLSYRHTNDHIPTCKGLILICFKGKQYMHTLCANSSSSVLNTDV